MTVRISFCAIAVLTVKTHVDTRPTYNSDATVQHLGLLGALVAVYVLMAAYIQSRGDPLIVLLALPFAFCDIVGRRDAGAAASSRPCRRRDASTLAQRF